MSAPLVTIVTPSYNQGHFIRRTIESVLSQDYPHIEYIVMDGGSQDETASVVKEYSSRLTWVSEKDRGQSHAINKGFQRGKGSILYWLNSDDSLLAGGVRHAVDGFREDPQAAVVYGEGYLMDMDGSITGRFPYTQPFNLWRLAHLSDYILQQAAFFRRTALEAAGWLDEDLHYAMDWDIFIRLGRRFPLRYIPHYLGCLREHPYAKTSSGGYRRVKEIRRVLERHTGLRCAPGVIVYGLDTLRETACRFLRSAIPAVATGHAHVLEDAVRYSSGYVIGRLVQHAQGWYSDGWATPRTRWMVPMGEGPVVLRGELPVWATQLYGQRLTVTRRRRTVGRFALEPGPFTLVLPRDAVPEDEAVELEFRATHFLIPSVNAKVNDPRRLAYILADVARRAPGAGEGAAEEGAKDSEGSSHAG